MPRDVATYLADQQRTSKGDVASEWAEIEELYNKKYLFYNHGIFYGIFFFFLKLKHGEGYTLLTEYTLFASWVTGKYTSFA